MFYYLNLYYDKNGEPVLKQVKNRHAYISYDWTFIRTYVIFDHKLYTYDQFRNLCKTRRFNFFEKVILFFKNL